ncbi:MAG: hypothetical protein ACLR7Z_09115 [Bilophila wadsworthia]
MKHILFGLAAVLFASSVALADDQLTVQVKPASAEAANPPPPFPPRFLPALMPTSIPQIRNQPLPPKSPLPPGARHRGFLARHVRR